MHSAQFLQDSAAFDRLDNLSDDSLRNLFPSIHAVLSRPKDPALPIVLSCMKKRENLFFPFVSDILRSKDARDGNGKYWVMSQLIPGFTAEHQQALRKQIEHICFVPSCSDEDMALSDCAEECLEHCFGSIHASVTD